MRVLTEVRCRCRQRMLPRDERADSERINCCEDALLPVILDKITGFARLQDQTHDCFHMMSLRKEIETADRIDRVAAGNELPQIASECGRVTGDVRNLARVKTPNSLNHCGFRARP